MPVYDVNYEASSQLRDRFNRYAPGIPGGRYLSSGDSGVSSASGIYTGPIRDPNLEYEARQLELLKLMAPLQARLQQSREENMTGLAKQAMALEGEGALQSQKLAYGAEESMYDRALRAALQREQLGFQGQQGRLEAADRARLMAQQYGLMGQNREAEQLLGHQLGMEGTAQQYDLMARNQAEQQARSHGFGMEEMGVKARIEDWLGGQNAERTRGTQDQYLRTQFGLLTSRDDINAARERELWDYQQQQTQQRTFQNWDQRVAMETKLALNSALGQAQGAMGQLEQPGIEKVKGWIKSSSEIDQWERSGDKYSPQQITQLRQQLQGEIAGTNLSLLKRGPKPGDILPGNQIGLSAEDVVMIDEKGRPQSVGWNQQVLGQYNPQQWAQSQASFARPEVDSVTGQPTGRGYFIRSSQGKVSFVPVPQGSQPHAMNPSKVALDAEKLGGERVKHGLFALERLEARAEVDPQLQLTPQLVVSASTDTVNEWFESVGKKTAMNWVRGIPDPAAQQEFMQRASDPLRAAMLIGQLEDEGVQGEDFTIPLVVRKSMRNIQSYQAQQQAAMQAEQQNIRMQLPPGVGSQPESPYDQPPTSPPPQGAAGMVPDEQYNQAQTVPLPAAQAELARQSAMADAATQRQLRGEQATPPQGVLERLGRMIPGEAPANAGGQGWYSSVARGQVAPNAQSEQVAKQQSQQSQREQELSSIANEIEAIQRQYGQRIPASEQSRVMALFQRYTELGGK